MEKIIQRGASGHQFRQFHRSGWKRLGPPAKIGTYLKLKLYAQHFTANYQKSGKVAEELLFRSDVSDWTPTEADEENQPESMNHLNYLACPLLHHLQSCWQGVSGFSSSNSNKQSHIFLGFAPSPTK